MHRVEVRLKSHLPDARGAGLVKDIRDLGIETVSDVRVVDIYWLDAELSPDRLDLICRSLLADPVIQDYQSDSTISADTDSASNRRVVEVTYNPGVMDPVEETVMKAVRDMKIGGVRAVKTAKRYLIEGELDNEQLESICSKLLIQTRIRIWTRMQIPTQIQTSMRTPVNLSVLNTVNRQVAERWRVRAWRRATSAAISGIRTRTAT